MLSSTTKAGSTRSSAASYRMYSGLCPDVGCQTKLVFPAYESSIECTSCGQRHEQKSLHDLREVTDPNVMLHAFLRNVLLSASMTPKKGAEMVKVLGLSNYHCKQLSHLLTRYGMDKSGKCRPLSELYERCEQTFDCSVLGDRCFLINPEHVDVVGYGRDISGSASYLADTLGVIRDHNGGDERLLPIHADGDGHCLVHAISRALVGRELFWHPLRTSLKKHFATNLDQYKMLFHDFINDIEWLTIIDECDPDFQPPDDELLGLRNVHIFGLANVLKRPIILLDSLKGMQSSGDYAATFLPSLIDPVCCRSRTGELNKPLVIAWSNQGRNHYIALVGIKNRPLPRLPRVLVPKAWGVPNHLVDQYIEFDQDGYCVIGGDKYLHDSYVLRLVAAMEVIYLQMYGVHPALVADVHHYIYKRTGVVGAKLTAVLEATRRATLDKRLYVCLHCSGVCEQRFLKEWFQKGGDLYALAEMRHGRLHADQLYTFPLQGVVCTYDPENDELNPTDRETYIEKCSWCHGSQIRLVNGDGSIEYKNGDRTRTAARSSHCNCGFKHFWGGREYDNQPKIIPVILEWAGKVINEKIVWFEHESDSSLNSNVYEVTDRLIQKHFPGIFGIERLVKKVVDQILDQTKRPEEKRPQQLIYHDEQHQRPTSPQKIILSGYGVVHKEELTKSQAERTVRERIKQNAASRQRRISAERQGADHARLTLTSTNSTTASLLNASQPAVDAIAVPVQAISKMVRIVTSDGRQLTISMESGALTPASLLGRLTEEMGIDRLHLKKILYGFPPKDLPLSLLEDTDRPLPFQPGDKVSVEVTNNTIDTDLYELVGSAIKSLPMDTTDVLQRLQDIQNTNMDNLDASITSLMLAATLTNQSVWSHVQQLPNLFTSGGLLYLQVKRDIGLADHKHCRLSIVPDKVFCYNAKMDRLELCIEPHGHFAVERGVEENALLQRANTTTTTTPQPSTSSIVIHGVSELLQSGSSGVCVNKGGQAPHDPSRTPFYGHGYTIKTEPTPESSTSAANMAISQSLISNETKRDSGDEVDREEMMDSGESSRDSASTTDNFTSPQPPSEFLRKGPGYSVLNPLVPSLASLQEHRERFQMLADELRRQAGTSHSLTDEELNSTRSDTSSDEHL